MCFLPCTSLRWPKMLFLVPYSNHRNKSAHTLNSLLIIQLFTIIPRTYMIRAKFTYSLLFPQLVPALDRKCAYINAWVMSDSFPQCKSLFLMQLKYSIKNTFCFQIALQSLPYKTSTN